MNNLNSTQIIVLFLKSKDKIIKIEGAQVEETILESYITETITVDKLHIQRVDAVSYWEDCRMKKLV